MNVLVIDTATRIEIVTVKAKEKFCDATSCVDISHSVTLFDRIDEALKGAGIAIQDIELIGVGTGPGSFTGIRIAVASARMLAQVLQVPLVGMESPLLWALAADAAAGDAILAAFDAKKGRVFGALYKKTGQEQLSAIVPPGDFYMPEILSAFDSSGALICIGEGIERFENDIFVKAPGSAVIRDFMPSGIPACNFAEALFAREPDTYRDFSAVLPHYARKSDAEILLEEKKKSR